MTTTELIKYGRYFHAVIGAFEARFGLPMERAASLYAVEQMGGWDELMFGDGFGTMEAAERFDAAFKAQLAWLAGLGQHIEQLDAQIASAQAEGDELGVLRLAREREWMVALDTALRTVR